MRFFHYFSVLGVLLTLAAIMAVKNVAILVTFVTAGLGIPLIFSAGLLGYALCLFPAVALWQDNLSLKVLGGVLSAAAIACFAVVPGMLGQRRAEEAVRPLLVQDHKPNSPMVAASLEIRRPMNDYSGLFTDNEACGFECRSLLARGQIKWVRVVMSDTATKSKAPSSTFHTLLQGPGCDSGPSSNLASTACVIMADDKGEEAELIMDFGRGPTVDTTTKPLQLLRWRQAKSVAVFQRKAGQQTEIFRQTQVDVSIPMTPTILGPDFQGMSSAGFDLLHTARQFNKITLLGTLSALGYSFQESSGAPVVPPKPRDWRDGIDEAMTRELDAVLNLAQTQPFNSEQAAVVFNWLMHARQIDDWTPELLDTLRRILHDPRLKTPTFFDQIFERQPAVTEALLPDVLDMLEALGTGPEFTPAKEAAFKFTQIDPKYLEPFAGRITGLIGTSPEMQWLLLPSVGRLGVDPLPYLVPFTSDLNANQRMTGGNPRLRGACFADRRWAPALIPALRTAFDPARKATSQQREFNLAVLKTLANLGDIAFVEEALASPNYNDDPRLAGYIRRDASDTRSVNRICWF